MISFRPSEHRTGLSEGAESRKALSPWSHSIAESVCNPLSQCLDGSGKIWGPEEQCQEGLGIEEGANWS